MSWAGLAIADVGEESSAAEFISLLSGATTQSTTRPDHVAFKASSLQINVLHNFQQYHEALMKLNMCIYQ